METLTSADAFPELYRAILDGVAGLEQAGRRAEAHRIRRDATATYSGAWSDAGQRRLASLVAASSARSPTTLRRARPPCLRQRTDRSPL